jgi:type IV pilus assembly protein PilC/MSHA biogenesis protein MshG
MPIFQYSGVDAEGRVERGMLQGDSIENVARRLEEKGIRVEQLGIAQSHDPLSATVRGAVEFGSSDMPQRALDISEPKVRLEELQFFFTQLGTMLNAGITGADALNTLSNQASNARLRRVLRETRDLAIAGRPISEGFSRHPEVFSQLMMAMVHAGERGGFLAEQCRHMAEYLRRDIELRDLIRKETAYPKIVIVFSIIVILFANTVIEVAGHEGAQKIWSPLTTPANWIVLGPVLALVWYYFKVVKKRPAAQYNWDKRVLGIPYIGQTVHGFAMAKFGRSFGALYKAGVPIGESIKLAADACGNQYVRSQVYPAAQGLEEGAGITDTLARTGAFSPIVLDMTRTGEVTGDVDGMLIKVSEFYEAEGAVRAKQAAIIFGVVVFVCVAVYVFIVMLKFYSERLQGLSNAGEA